MKKSFVALCIMVCIASTVFAVDFSPSTMELIVEETINYEFDGSKLDIPIEVIGAPASLNFLVYTKGQANAIGTVQNGHLGWHYVNGIDTCLFVSNDMSFGIGQDQFTWEGKDSDGGTVPPGDYTYYIFAFDNQTPRQVATNIYKIGYSYTNTIESADEEGNPLANPIMYIHGDKKWRVGSDPEDMSLIETTTYRSGYSRGTHLALDPQDHSLIYVQDASSADMTMNLVKYKWVPNGAAEIQTDWAEDGISNMETMPNYYPVQTGAFTDGETIWCSIAYPFAALGEGESQVFFTDLEEGVINSILILSDWYLSAEDTENEGQFHGGPDGMYFRNNILFTQSLEGCMTLAFDPYREDPDEMVLWVNDNGDYTHDHNFEETAAHPWLCNDFMTGPYTYGISVDSNNFNIYPAFDMGAVTFAIISGADGTGMGYKALANETADFKATAQFIDEGTAYDGIYTDGRGDETGTYFVASESITGTISNIVKVADEAPASFSIAQNSPNPFNPTTTISFSIANAGNVNVDIYNVAGQKIDTLANEFMDSGSHSLVWNATDFSAGVYFYTVKTGDFSKTMKMTLVK